MKKTIGLIAAVLALAGSPAQANDTWKFSYTDTLTGLLAFGAGTFETASGPGAILSIVGTANGSAITGLSTYAGADNIFGGTGTPFSFSGTSFSTAGGTDWNLYNLPGALRSDLNPVGIAPFEAGQYPISLNVAAVPEPETFAMLLSGLGLIGMIGRRRSIAAKANA